MTQKERLIELLCEVKCEGSDRREGGCGFRQDGKCNRIDKLDMCMLENIAEWLLENGVIVPSLAIGLKVYQIDGERIYESRIINVVPEPTPFVYDTSGIAFDEDAIGNSVFLSYEAAEKALAERGEA